MVYHFTHWSWVAINLLAKKFASITPNMAYVSDAPIPGRTVKACQRALVNLTEPGKFGFNTDIGPGYDYDRKAFSNGSALPYSYSEKWSGKSGFASLPWLGNDPQGFSDGGHSWLTMGEYRSKALSVVKPHEELEPLEHGHPLRRLIENPNPFDTQYDLRYELLMFRKLTGVSYLWMCPNDWGMPAELWVLPSHWVWPRTGGGKYVSPDFPHADELIQYYEVRPWGGMGSAGMLRIPPNEVMMTLYKSPINKIDGYSPLHAMARWQDLEESNSQARWSQMVNMARPEMAIKLGPGYEDVDDDRIARIEAKFLAKLQGEANTGKPFILPSGAELQLLSFTPEQMLYGGTEEQVRDMLLSGHNVPPAAVGLVKEMTYGCLDTETECLTSQGWKKYTELTFDIRIACYDPGTNTLIYRKPSRIIVRPYKGKMYRWLGQRFDALLSPSHRVFVQRFKGRKRRVSPFEPICVRELTPGRNVRVMGAAPAACDDPQTISVEQYGGRYERQGAEANEIDPRLWLEFIGYYISEGCAAKPTKEGKNRYSIDIAQRMDSPLTPKIQKCVDALPFKRGWRRYNYAGNPCYHWRCNDRGLHEHLIRHCGQGSRNKRIPDYVKAWPAADLRILLDALLAGDGRRPRTVKKSGTWFTSYRTVSSQLADDVMEIAIKCGLSARIARSKNDGDCITVNITSRTSITVMPDQRTEEDYDGDIWCLTVPTGLFVVRRNGKAQVTGNSILATLSALCSFGLNPELVQEGQALTKHLASKYDENAPAYSAGFSEVSPGTFQSRGFGGRATFHKIRVWYDDCVPADPQQVNNDIQADQASYAITPNEVRALRGRKPYKLGGNNPMVQGPGGIMPYPMNEVEDVGDFADVIGELSQADAKNEPDEEPEGQALPGSPLGDDGKPDTPAKPLDGSPLANGKKPKKPEGRRGEDVRPPKNPPPEDTMGKPKKPKPDNEVGTPSNGKPKLTAGPPKKPNGPPKKGWEPRASPGVAPQDAVPVRSHDRIGMASGHSKDWSPSDTMGSCVCGHDRDDHDGGVTGCNLCECPDYQVVHNGVQDVELDDEVEKAQNRKVDDEALRKADFIRLPDGVDGTNCSNCLHMDSGKCQFEGELPGGGYVDLRGLPVTERDCCVAWNADGVGRDWEKGWRHPLVVFKELDDAGYSVNDLTVDDEKAMGDTVQAAGAWLARRWESLEARYGRKTALAMAVSMAATIPIPGSIPAIVAAAEAIRGLQGYFQRELGEAEVVK